MSESYNYLTKDLIPSLRAKASRDSISQLPKIQYLLRGHTDISLFRLLELYPETTNYTQPLNYLLALLLNRVIQESPIGAEVGVQVFMLIKYFITQINIKAEHIWNLYSSPLLLEISKSEPDQLEVWANELENCVNIKELKIPIGWLFERLKIEALESLSELASNPSIEMVGKIIKIIKTAANLDQDIEDTANFAFFIILKYFFEANDLDDFYSSISKPKKQDIYLLSSIIHCLSSLKSLFTKPTKRLSRKIKKAVEKLKEKKSKKKTFSEEDLCNADIDLNSIIFQENHIYQHSFENFTVMVKSGTNAQGCSIIVKFYYNFYPNFNFSLIENEIKIMTFLSNRTLEKKSFVKLYYVHRDNNQISVFMENGGINLMNYMTQVKNQGAYINKNIIQNWIVTLIETFAWLSNNRIYHCDIKPHNILVNTKDMTLKVIDFGVSHFAKEIEASYSPTVAHPIQGTEGYMAPELTTALGNNQRIANFKPGKSDVFSLGITILQIITLEKLLGFNSAELNPQLLNKVEKLNTEGWIKSLLMKMLDVNRQQRLSFNKCLQVLPRDDDPTNIA